MLTESSERNHERIFESALGLGFVVVVVFFLNHLNITSIYYKTLTLTDLKILFLKGD